MLRRFFYFTAAMLVAGAIAQAEPRVTVIEDAPWSPNDPSRDGAAEFRVMLHIAKLQAGSSVVGIVGVGDKRGVFQEGTRRGLEMAVQHGVPVVRLARGVRTYLKNVDRNPDDLFIDGGLLTPEAAQTLLVECLARHGALPRVRATDTAVSASELTALRQKLQLYQAEFTAHQPEMIASR